MGWIYAIFAKLAASDTMRYDSFWLCCCEEA